MKKLVLYFLAILFILKIQVFTTGCANIVPPEGGLRDSLPPVLVKANPPENSHNQTENRIVLTFDEFVDVDNPQANIIVSPIPKNQPNVTRKLNTVTIKIRDTLEPNTTYALNFGNSIKDVNEGNVFKEFTYVFSTGSYIDTLQFGGKIIMAETGKSDSTLMVILHRSKDDSAIVKENPRYVTKTNGKGIFLFKNLSPGTYYAYALKAENNNYIYRGQIFAFADSAVVVGSETKPITLYAYEPIKKETPGSSAPPPRPNKPAAGEKPRLKFATNLSGGKQDLLEKLILTFETPVKTFDSTKVHISTDTLYTPLASGYRWDFDSTKKALTLTNPWKENTLYTIILEKDFATDTLDQQLLRPDTLSFITKSNSDYGKLSIRFRNLDLAKNPVLLFVQTDKVAMSFPLNSDTFTDGMFPPGEYELRVLNDTNKNGKWDPGDFIGKHLQPELVKPVPRKVTIKANWDNSFEIAL